MENNNDKRNVELSKSYNQALQHGDYEQAVKDLYELADIAASENRMNDMAKLLRIATYIILITTPVRVSKIVERWADKK